MYASFIAQNFEKEATLIFKRTGIWGFVRLVRTGGEEGGTRNLFSKEGTKS